MTRIFTIGHSTRSLQEFIDLLHANAIALLVDVRSYPGSRRYPHFGREPLRAALAEAGIDYLHSAHLGGRRPARPGSLNIAWRDSSFRAYADHMETEEFKEAIQDLIGLANERPVVIMCAEALWWKCHRALISDYLKSIGVEVVHIGTHPENETHPYTSAARIVDGHLDYRAKPSD